MPSVAEPPMRPIPTPAPNTAKPAASPAPLRPRPLPVAPVAAAASCSRASMYSMFDSVSAGDPDHLCARRGTGRLSRNGLAPATRHRSGQPEQRASSTIRRSTGSAGESAISTEIILLPPAHSGRGLIPSPDPYRLPPLMLRPHEPDEHRGEQGEHEGLQERDKDLE